jgi:hypothetical protein
MACSDAAAVRDAGCFAFELPLFFSLSDAERRATATHYRPRARHACCRVYLRASALLIDFDIFHR